MKRVFFNLLFVAIVVSLTGCATILGKKSNKITRITFDDTIPTEKQCSLNILFQSGLTVLKFDNTNVKWGAGSGDTVVTIPAGKHTLVVNFSRIKENSGVLSPIQFRYANDLTITYDFLQGQVFTLNSKVLGSTVSLDIVADTNKNIAGPNETLVYITRKTGGAGSLIPVTILLDGIEVSEPLYSNNSTLKVIVPNGAHTLEANFGSKGSIETEKPHSFTADSRPISFSVKMAGFKYFRFDEEKIPD